MVHITQWNEFLQQAHELFIHAPATTRYVVKYNASNASIQLRVTDDVKSLQFETHLQNDLRYVDRINSAFFKLMTAKDPTTVDLKDELIEEQKKLPTHEKKPSSSTSSSTKKSSASANATSNKKAEKKLLNQKAKNQSRKRNA